MGAIGIEGSIRGGYGSFAQAPVESENEPNETAIVGFTRGRGSFQNNTNFGSPGNFRGRFQSNFGYSNSRGRGSSVPQSPQSTSFNVFAVLASTISPGIARPPHRGADPPLEEVPYGKVVQSTLFQIREMVPQRAANQKRQMMIRKTGLKKSRL